MLNNVSVLCCFIHLSHQWILLRCAGRIKNICAEEKDLYCFIALLNKKVCLRFMEIQLAMEMVAE